MIAFIPVGTQVRT